MVHGRPDRSKDEAWELHAALVTASPLVLAMVSSRRQKTVKQVAVGFDFYAVYPCLLAAHRRPRVLVGNPLQVPRFGYLRGTPVKWFRDSRGPNYGQPVPCVRVCPPAEVRYLYHHGSTLRMHVFR